MLLQLRVTGGQTAGQGSVAGHTGILMVQQQHQQLWGVSVAAQQQLSDYNSSVRHVCAWPLQLPHGPDVP